MNRIKILVLSVMLFSVVNVVAKDMVEIIGNVNWRGSQTVSRERLLDAIPFKKSLKVDMEAWNGAGVRYTAGVMWYARPGATSNRDAKP